MREIKFRGKNGGGEWIYGMLIQDYDVPILACWIASRTPNQGGVKYLGCFFHNVISETVGQFTGLFDKNGVEIYEGDIVQKVYGGIVKERLRKTQGVVVFDNQLVYKDEFDIERRCAGYFFEFPDKSGYCPLIGTEVEVIGNIYENSSD